MRIAAAAYPFDRVASWSEFEAKLSAWVAEAAGAGAELLVFPEYAGVEVASIGDRGAMAASIDAVGEMLGEIDALHAALAERYGVHLLAGSVPLRDGPGLPLNRARLFTPEGGVGIQDKLMMTRFEREEWGVRAGRSPRVFETALGRIGILTCYDAEFPLLARAMVEAGAEILLAPSNTEALSGYWRVRIGAMARALEGQCVVVHSPTVGPAPWLEALDMNTGAAAIYGPPDTGFPETGVLAEGRLQAPGWVYGDVSLEAIAHVRADGRVLNLAHWPEQVGEMAPVERVALG